MASKSLATTQGISLVPKLQFRNENAVPKLEFGNQDYSYAGAEDSPAH
jgi:hypothetical protein